MNHQEKMDILGRMGEKYVSNYLAKKGVVVEQALNHFDNKKDLMGDGKTIEVKTQVPFIKEKAITIKPNQLRKCRGVDELYFVTVPAPNHFYKYSGWLFKVNPKTFTTRTYHTKDGRDMILIDIEQESVNPIQKVEDDVAKEMMKYTVSGY